MRFKNEFIFAFSLILLLNGCQKENRFHINTFQDPIKIEIHRFDLDFIGLDTANMVRELKLLEHKYPAFYPLFLSDILMANTNGSISYADDIRNFLKDTTFERVHHDVCVTFEHIDIIEEELSTAYSYLTHYFPKIQLPEIYFFVSGFNRKIIQNKCLIGIGVDLYLGASYPIYKELTHDYLIPTMRKEMLVSNLLSTILHNEFKPELDTKLLNAIIYEGKILFLLSIIMPNVTIENQIGFSKEALSWCSANEKHLWESMIANKHLSSTDPLLINQYINNAPFTSPISQASPGRLGIWIGWQIVQSYMQHNKEVGLSELMNTIPAKTILEQSMYRP